MRGPHISKHPHNGLILSALVLVLVSACTQVPELDATVPKHLHAAAYPALISLDGSLATHITPQDQSEQIERTLTGRAERLQARAEALKTPIVDGNARTRMKNGVTP